MREGSRERKPGGIFVRRECWTLSFSGKVISVLLMGFMFSGLLIGLHPFLTVNTEGTGEVMVVEGWISSRPIDQAATAFRRGHYQSVLVVRDVYKGGDKWSSGRYAADYVAAELVEQGVPQECVHVVFCPAVRKDRTYHCALAAREWLKQNDLKAKTLDVVTLAAHSRRSRLLYEKAFGGEVTIGAIALDDVTYDPDHWWQTSAGAREVLGEAIAYAHTRLFWWFNTTNE